MEVEKMKQHLKETILSVGKNVTSFKKSQYPEEIEIILVEDIPRIAMYFSNEDYFNEDKIKEKFAKVFSCYAKLLKNKKISVNSTFYFILVNKTEIYFFQPSPRLADYPSEDFLKEIPYLHYKYSNIVELKYGLYLLLSNIENYPQKAMINYQEQKLEEINSYFTKVYNELLWKVIITIFASIVIGFSIGLYF